jgi:CheY-like chemotaxis protein
MAKARILIVEDESVVAKDIQTRLKGLGYAVSAIASSGEVAIQKAAGTHPDLVLMDIVLKGDVDGIEAASQIRSRLNIPVLYLTAYTDEKTLERAKITEPFVYIIKPFQERELHSNIEMALFKHKVERERKEMEEALRKAHPGPF